MADTQRYVKATKTNKIYIFQKPCIYDNSERKLNLQGKQYLNIHVLLNLIRRKISLLNRKNFQGNDKKYYGEQTTTDQKSHRLKQQHQLSAINPMKGVFPIIRHFMNELGESNCSGTTIWFTIMMELED